MSLVLQLRACGTTACSHLLSKRQHPNCVTRNWVCCRDRTFDHPHRSCIRGSLRVCAVGNVLEDKDAADKASPSDSVDPWKVAVDKQLSGEAVECEILRCNKGGVVVSTGQLEGFIPFSKLAPGRLPPGHKGELDFLVGQKLQAKLVSVDPQARNGRGELVLSEQQVAVASALGKLSPGDIVTCTVTKAATYGAFVVVDKVQGRPDIDVTGLIGMIHISQLSWSRVVNVESVVSVGQVLQAQVTEADTQRCRLSLSLKALQADPLKQTIANVLPRQNGDQSAAIVWREAQKPLPGVSGIIATLQQVEGINEVTLRRQADLKSATVQELEVWLTKDEVEDGFNVVVREGGAMQELHLSTRLTREQVKDAMKMVLRRGTSVPLPQQAAVAPTMG